MGHCFQGSRQGIYHNGVKNDGSYTGGELCFCAIWAAIGLMVSSWIPDRYMVMVVPITLFCMLIFIGNINPAWIEMMPHWLIRPSSIDKPYIFYFIIGGCEILLCALGYYWGVRRRVKHAHFKLKSLKIRIIL